MEGFQGVVRLRVPIDGSSPSSHIWGRGERVETEKDLLSGPHRSCEALRPLWAEIMWGLRTFSSVDSGLSLPAISLTSGAKCTSVSPAQAANRGFSVKFY